MTRFRCRLEFLRVGPCARCGVLGPCKSFDKVGTVRKSCDCLSEHREVSLTELATRQSFTDHAVRAPGEQSVGLGRRCGVPECFEAKGRGPLSGCGFGADSHDIGVVSRCFEGRVDLRRGQGSRGITLKLLEIVPSQQRCHVALLEVSDRTGQCLQEEEAVAGPGVAPPTKADRRQIEQLQDGHRAKGNRRFSPAKGQVIAARARQVTTPADAYEATLVRSRCGVGVKATTIPVRGTKRSSTGVASRCSRRTRGPLPIHAKATENPRRWATSACPNSCTNIETRITTKTRAISLWEMALAATRTAAIPVQAASRGALTETFWFGTSKSSHGGKRDDQETRLDRNGPPPRVASVTPRMSWWRQTGRTDRFMLVI